MPGQVGSRPRARGPRLVRSGLLAAMLDRAPLQEMLYGIFGLSAFRTARRDRHASVPGKQRSPGLAAGWPRAGRQDLATKSYCSRASSFRPTWRKMSPSFWCATARPRSGAGLGDQCDLVKPVESPCRAIPCANRESRPSFPVDLAPQRLARSGPSWSGCPGERGLLGRLGLPHRLAKLGVVIERPANQKQNGRRGDQERGRKRRPPAGSLPEQQPDRRIMRQDRLAALEAAQVLGQLERRRIAPGSVVSRGTSDRSSRSRQACPAGSSTAEPDRRP